MAEVNGVYKHGRYQRIWLKSLHIMLSDKVFATQDSWLDTTDYIDPYVTHGSKRPFLRSVKKKDHNFS